MNANDDDDMGARLSAIEESDLDSRAEGYVQVMEELRARLEDESSAHGDDR